MSADGGTDAKQVFWTKTSGALVLELVLSPPFSPFPLLFSSRPLFTARPSAHDPRRHERRKLAVLLLSKRAGAWIWYPRVQCISNTDAAYRSAWYVLTLILATVARVDLIIVPLVLVQIAEMHPSYHLSGLNQYPAGVYSTSPPHGSLPLNSPPPPSPELYDALSPPVSGSDTSGDGLYHHSNSSGANSPSSSRGHSLVHRSHRYNPTPSPTSSSSRRRSRSHDSEDDDDDVMGIAADQNLAYSRKEATRRQRIEAEQRRRDELREGYAKLKDALPVSNQKSSKVSLLERGKDRPSSAYYLFSSFLI